MNQSNQDSILEHKEHFHGSDLEKIEKVYGISKDDIVSFSANVNPLGLSTLMKNELAKHLDVLTSYPDREYTKLRESIADYVNTAAGNVVVGNGSTELISLFIKFSMPKHALILGPTYSEYQHEVELCGGKSEYFRLREEADFEPDTDELISSLDAGYDLLVLCNPNNPTSSAFTALQLGRILDKCRQLGIFVIIDETYVEFSERYDEINAIPLTHNYDNLVVLRGISKFFAAPGLRLGYAVTSSTKIRQQVIDIQNAWSINSLAEAAGKLMFSDAAYIAATKELIFTEREHMTRELSAIDGLKVYPADANFILIRILKDGIDADLMFDEAIKEGMMIRNCASFEYLDNSYFRVCVMSPEDNERLLKCIKRVMGKN